MSDPTILFVKPKAISLRDKKELKSAGVIVVEVDDPSSVKLTRAAADLESGGMLRAAAHAIMQHNHGTENVRALFGKAICAALAQDGRE